MPDVWVQNGRSGQGEVDLKSAQRSDRHLVTLKVRVQQYFAREKLSGSFRNTAGRIQETLQGLCRSQPAASWGSLCAYDFPQMYASQVFFFKRFIFIVCIWVFFLDACMCPTCVPGAQEDEKRDLGSLELELHVAMSHLMWVLVPLHEQQAPPSCWPGFQHIVYFHLYGYLQEQFSRFWVIPEHWEGIPVLDPAYLLTLL